MNIDDLSEEECSQLLLEGLKYNNPELRITEVYQNNSLIYAEVFDPENSNVVFEIKVKGFDNLRVERD